MANIKTLPLTVDNMSQLLQDQRDYANRTPQSIIYSETERLRAQRPATIYDLIKMISEIITKATKKRNVVFEPDEGARPRVDQSLPLNESHIYYEVTSRRPDGELKPREREEVLDIDTEGKTRKGRIWGQRFKCYVQFNIFAGDYLAANNVTELFEDLMFNYTSYFKKNGVAEILFDEQITDHNLDIYRNSLSIRSLRYCVWVEKLHAAFDTAELDGIITTSNVKKEE